MCPIPGSYLPYTRQKSALDLIPVPNWYDSFKNVPDTSTCQVLKKEKKNKTLIPVLVWYVQKVIPVQHWF